MNAQALHRAPWRLVGLIMLLLLSRAAAPFTVECFGFQTAGGDICVGILGTANHENITRSALHTFKPTPPSLLTFNGTAIGFTEDALKQIVDANWKTDTPEWNVRKVHFDDESFGDAQTRLWNLRQQIDTLLLTGGDGSDARKLLGEALHSVQDFYSHSTWVELGNTSSTAQLGEADDSGTLIDLTNGVPIPLQTCTVGGLVNPPVFTSEYPWPLNTLETSTYTVTFDDDPEDVPPGAVKCAHGPANACNVQDPTTCPGAGTHLGINKDTNLRVGFSTAQTLAIKATQRYVNNILSDLNQQAEPLAYSIAACRLLGQPLSKCVGASSTTDAVFTYQGVGPLNRYGEVFPTIPPLTGTVVFQQLPQNFTGSWTPEMGQNATFTPFGAVIVSTMLLGDPNACAADFLVYSFQFSNGGIVAWTVTAEPPTISTGAPNNQYNYTCNTGFTTSGDQKGGGNDVLDNYNEEFNPWESTGQGTWTRVQ